jgi:hypothetical protein
VCNNSEPFRTRFRTESTLSLSHIVYVSVRQLGLYLRNVPSLSFCLTDMLYLSDVEPGTVEVRSYNCVVTGEVPFPAGLL